MTHLGSPCQWCRTHVHRSCNYTNVAKWPWVFHQRKEELITAHRACLASSPPLFLTGHPGTFFERSSYSPEELSTCMPRVYAALAERTFDRTLGLMRYCAEQCDNLDKLTVTAELWAASNYSEEAIDILRERMRQITGDSSLV